MAPTNTLIHVHRYWKQSASYIPRSSFPKNRQFSVKTLITKKYERSCLVQLLDASGRFLVWPNVTLSYEQELRPCGNFSLKVTWEDGDSNSISPNFLNCPKRVELGSSYSGCRFIWTSQQSQISRYSVDGVYRRPTKIRNLHVSVLYTFSLGMIHWMRSACVWCRSVAICAQA